MFPRLAAELAVQHEGVLRHVFNGGLRGFAVDAMTEAHALQLAADPMVAHVEQNQLRFGVTTQSNPPSFGLDRIDQRWFPLNGRYNYASDAANVTAYVIDSGIRISHSDFGGRARYGFDVIDNDAIADDCNGHGTNVAGTIGGAVHGVAKAVRLVAVRALDCNRTGDVANVDHGAEVGDRQRVKPAVANISIGGGFSPMEDQAVNNLTASGVALSSRRATTAPIRTPRPAMRATTRLRAAPSAITVGATTTIDARAPYSNVGPCLDIFAPGDNITTLSHLSDTGTVTLAEGGTSMAAPHVAGAAALYLSTHSTAQPGEISAALTTAATTGRIIYPGPGSPDRLLFTQPPPSCPTIRDHRVVSIPDPGAVAASLNYADCTRNASSTTTVTVTIRHPNRGDLAIKLVSPDGAKVFLLQSSSSDTGDDIVKTYTVNASSAFAGGLWALQVDDVRRGQPRLHRKLGPDCVTEALERSRNVTLHSRGRPADRADRGHWHRIPRHAA